MDEKNEVRQLRAEQDELKTHEQQLLSTPVENEDDDAEHERARQGLNEQLGQELPTGSPAPTPIDLTSEQLKAELEHVRLQRDADRQALKEANELLA